MAQRYGGKHSPEGQNDALGTKKRRRTIKSDPAGGRANIMFVPAIVLFFTSLGGGAVGLGLAVAGAASWTLGAWLLREGLRAEAVFNERKVARRPAIPRKLFAAVLTGLGAAFAVAAHMDGVNVVSPVLYGVIAAALHGAAFGLDPMRDKGLEGIDSFQQDRVARVVDEAEKHLAAMSAAITRAGDRSAEARLADFQDTARALIRTVEEDPRDLAAARKFLGIYLQGARDATIKFADLYARNGDNQARTDYFALLDDLDKNFAARNARSLLDDRSDLTIEIDVLRERLQREGVRLDVSRD